MINVTKTYLPPFEEYIAILKRPWDKGWITNNGELVQELEQKLKEYLGVKNLLFTCNGTIVLQMALKPVSYRNVEGCSVKGFESQCVSYRHFFYL